MSELAKRLAGLTPAQRQLLEKRLQKASTAAEPIAIVGMACRFPGAPSLAAFWRLIHEGIEAVSEIPRSRWDIDEFFDPTGEQLGKISVRWGCFVDDADQFDPQFFGITPREASQMDPQQRLLLEVAWETMENAGLPADQLAGSKTGVFVGIGGTDYSKVLMSYENYFEAITAYSGTGNALSIAANRLSYIFDLHGPSLSVDTACSSSSLGIHLAVEALRRGECDAALAGGVNMILTPETTIAFSKARMLSPEGKCRPFDARANGYVRGEGCGMVLLKRLSDAIDDGDQVLAIVRATAVNQDGRTSGISAPNGQAQLACIRAALKQAGVAPEQITYIEAHGTGTPLGDPIEMQALGEIFRRRSNQDAPLYVTSVKANVGHTETVSGVAGLIKTVLMMEHEEIVPQLHFEQLNPHIHLDGTRLVVPTEHMPWSISDQPRTAGISSFGFGGTNTHVIVESPPAVTPSEQMARDERPAHILKLSAKTEAALAAQAERLREFVAEHADADLPDVAYSANTGRADFNYRAAIVAADRQQLGEILSSVAAGKPSPNIKRSTPANRGTLGRPKVAFLFTGQGAQYVGMGRGLFGSHPTFRDSLEQCDEILEPLWKRSLLEVLYPAGGLDAPSALVHQTQFTQPALFALEYALAELWRSWGVTPDIVLGHSLGEYVAAVVAGAMRLEDGLRLIAERSRLMQQVTIPGRMAAIFASERQVADLLRGYEGCVTIATINGPENTVISGDAEEVEAAVARFELAGIGVQMLNVSHAFHSQHMDEVLDEFEAFATKIEFHPPETILVSNLTGHLLQDAPTAKYWRDHLRNAVQFADGVRHVAQIEPMAVIELGPSTSLLSAARRCEPNLKTAWIPSLRHGQDDWQTLAGGVAEYYVRGGRIDWRAWDKPWPRRRLLLPNYPYERSRQWHELRPEKRRPYGDNISVGVSMSHHHPLLGTSLSTVWTNLLFETSLSAQSPAYLTDHQVQGSPVLPAAAYVELALAAADELFGPGRHAIENLNIQHAMFLPAGTRRRVQVSVAPESSGESTFETYSRVAEDEASSKSWVLHGTGRLVHESRKTGNELPQPIDLAAVRARAVSTTSRFEFYRLMAERGLAYGPAFQVLDELVRTPTDAMARVTLPEFIRKEARAYHLYPALGDALLQSMAGVVPLDKDGSYSSYTYMPVAIQRIAIHAPIEDLAQPLFTYAVRTSRDDRHSPETVEGNVALVNQRGEVLAAFEGVRVQRVGRGSGAGAAQDTADWLYRVNWQAMPLEQRASQVSAGSWLIFADRQGVAEILANQLAKLGQSSVLVNAGDSLRLDSKASTNGQASGQRTATIDPLDESHYRQLLQQAFADKENPCLGIVHLWSLDIPSAGAAAGDDIWNEARRLGCGSVLCLFRTLPRQSFAKSPAVWLVTAGAQVVDGQSAPVSVEQSALLGLGRVAALEQPEFRPRMVDLDPKADASIQVAALVQEVSADAAEQQIAYRDGARYVSRLRADADTIGRDASSGGDKLVVPAGKPYQLRITAPGSFDALRYVAVEREPPAAGQVELEIRAAGLNFSDVLKALGLYPGIRDAIVPLGIEASGTVTAVGEGVSRFQVGQDVMGVVPYAFASHARTAEYALVPKPKLIDHEEASTIPITYLTAYYGLVRLAQLQPGERVLIHAAAGGVGLAAIQIAHQIGAEVFATAGSDEKREFIRSLGVRHVMSSRTLDFADQILEATGREGVDVVLNSLPGEAITKSLSILRAYGRFLEIGKTDIYMNRMIGLLPFQDNLSYFAIDLDRMLRQRPEYIRELFAEVMRHFESGAYRPLMLTRFEAEGTIGAFRYMSQRKNIGKVVVSMAASGKPANTPQELPLVRSDGTYLITGGLGALGLRVAGWLAEQGAGAIALLGRRPPAPEQSESIRSLGTRVVTLQGDVTNLASLQAALRQLPADVPPLRGVIHAAGVLADGILADMQLDQLDKAMRPKVEGAWNLHLATLDAPLDFFVMFSSVASVLGSPGQANYAAGNAMLDALAHYRREQGLPSTAINWGPWADAGMAAQQGRGEGMQSRGMGSIPPKEGLALLGKLLRADVTQVAVMDVQWAEMLRLLGSRRGSLLADIAAEFEDTAGGPTASCVDHEFRNRLLEAATGQRETLVQDYIRDELARIMGVNAAKLETDQPLSTFGLDSLLALELKNNLENRLAFTLPMAKLMEGPSIASLAAETARLVVNGEAASAGAARNEASQWSPLLTLRAEGEQTPLVLLPGLAGDVRCYGELVQHLPPGRPVYVFRPRGIDDSQPPHRSMDEMIADYQAALMKIQPRGPYCLAGWSTGGIFAHALAQSLAESGAELGPVALFDTPLPEVFGGIDLADDSRFFCDMLKFASHFTGTNIRFDYEELASLDPETRFQKVLAEARKQGTISAEAPEDFIRRLVHVGEANVRVIQSYEPRPLGQAIALFVPAIKGGLSEVAGQAVAEESDLGWGTQLNQTVEIREVPGDHFGMMLGNGAVQLAQQLDALLCAGVAGSVR